jgi:predicted metal-dependent HD superfamily phosphohydrolase
MSIKNQIYKTLKSLNYNASCDIIQLALDVENAYSEHHRYYHNRKHLEDCFNEFEEVEKKICFAKLLKFALMYHDYVYIPKFKRNEEASSLKAEQDAKELGLSKDDLSVISHGIAATTHKIQTYTMINLKRFVHNPLYEDSKYIMDIDLCILGKDLEEFIAYENNIRKEYWFVDNEVFHEKRKEVLKSFCNRETIYSSKYFQKKYEKKALKNITYSIEKFHSNGSLHNDRHASRAPQALR